MSTYQSSRRRPLTDQERATMAFIARFVREHHYPPAVRDIQRGLRISSTSMVTYRLDALQSRGLITRAPGIARSIAIVGPAERWESAA